MSKNFCSLNDETCVYNQLEECKCEHDCEHKMDSKKPSYRELEQQNAELLEVLGEITDSYDRCSSDLRNITLKGIAESDIEQAKRILAKYEV